MDGETKSIKHDIHANVLAYLRDNGINLAEYGVHTEDSDYRLHVCFQEGAAYIFKTQSGVDAIETGRYILKPSYQKGVVGATGLGYLVPPLDIDGCQRIVIPQDIMDEVNCSKLDDPSERGRKAVLVAQRVMQRGLVFMPINIVDVDDKNMQIRGVDAKIQSDLKFQIKCDYNGGRRPRGTGNLYLQVAERNPNAIH